MAAKTTIIKPDNFKLYEDLVKLVKGVELKGATMPYTSLNGNMFSYLKDGVLGIRLPENEREQFLKKYKTTLLEAYGIIQKEYVTVPEKLFKKTKELKPYLEMSYEYAKTLKAKPTKKTKK